MACTEVVARPKARRFAVAALNVGVMDALRAEESANGITNVSEFGSAQRADGFPARDEHLPDR